MIWISAANLDGADDQHMLGRQPWHPVYVDAYWMDKTEVTTNSLPGSRRIRATQRSLSANPKRKTSRSAAGESGRGLGCIHAT
jgi:hypothetical protein